jgi:hypothetical protein
MGKEPLMRTAGLPLNPFSLMMEPELVLQAMERSTELRRLRRHKLRPLDKPMIPYSKAALAAMQAADEAENADAANDDTGQPQG